MSFQNPVFIPGPTNIPECLRKACDMPTIDHRSPLFGQILHPAREGVRKVLKSESAEIFIFPSTGTGGWETALTNTLSKGDRVLILECGRFATVWGQMATFNGIEVELIVADQGRAVDPALVEERLRADTDREIKAVLTAHVDTASSIRNDVPAIRAAIMVAETPVWTIEECTSNPCTWVCSINPPL